MASYSAEFRDDITNEHSPMLYSKSDITNYQIVSSDDSDSSGPCDLRDQNNNSGGDLSPPLHSKVNRQYSTRSDVTGMRNKPAGFRNNLHSFSVFPRDVTSSHSSDSRDDSLISLNSDLEPNTETEFDPDSVTVTLIDCPLESSGDESDHQGRDSAPRRKSKLTRVHSTENSPSTNTNSNNNRKKRHFAASRKEINKSRSVNFRIQQPPVNRRRSHRTGRMPRSNKHDFNENKNTPWRNHSVQLSSMRAMSNSENSTVAKSIAANTFGYGPRMMNKDGTSNITIKDNGKMDLWGRYTSDIFTTLIDSSWSWVLFITVAVYVSHWFIFGVIYWLFAALNNDYAKIFGVPANPVIDIGNLTNVSEMVETAEGDPCVFQVYDFISAFLFSMESETTIGYGTRTITPECPAAVACLTIQCIVSGIFDTWVIGVCYARIARPDARVQTTKFSHNAVICMRDGKRCLLVRFANLRKSLLLTVNLRARIITLRGAQNNERVVGHQKILEQREVEFKNANTTLLTAPIEYCHVIDEESPLYGYKSKMYNSEMNHFELILMLSGTIESTGLTMLAQTSYLSSEVLFGHRFVPIISKCKAKGNYNVDFSRFNDTTIEPSRMTKSDSDSSSIVACTEHRRGTITTLVEENENEVSVSDDVFGSKSSSLTTPVDEQIYAQESV